MNGRNRLACAITALIVLGAACTGRSEVTPTSLPTPHLGGTLKLVSPGSLFGDLDPQQTWWMPAIEIMRCCLLRTLLSFNGQDGAHGGAEVRPDLATSMPEISSDGLTWIFHIKPNVHYAPPLQHTEVTAQDLVRALQREGDPSSPHSATSTSGRSGRWRST